MLLLAGTALVAACGRVGFDPIVNDSRADATPGEVGIGDGGMADGGTGDATMACRNVGETCDQVTLVCCSDLVCIDIGGTLRCD